MADEVEIVKDPKREVEVSTSPADISASEYVGTTITETSTLVTHVIESGPPGPEPSDARLTALIIPLIRPQVTESVIRAEVDDVYSALGHSHVVSDITGLQSALDGKQTAADGLTQIAAIDPSTSDVIVSSGVGWVGSLYSNLKTLLNLDRGDVGLSNVDNTSDANKPISTAVSTALSGKQGTLVSGTNIKSINGSSILGSGDLTVESGYQQVFVQETQPTPVAGQPYVWYEVDGSGVLQDTHYFDGVI